ncbi:hypothetical protein ScPMuIL_015773 [Solemya velum]
MLFQFGLTVIIFIGVFLYYSIKLNDIGDVDNVTASKTNFKDIVLVKDTLVEAPDKLKAENFESKVDNREFKNKTSPIGEKYVKSDVEVTGPKINPNKNNFSDIGKKLEVQNLQPMKDHGDTNMRKKDVTQVQKKYPIHLAVVACGERLDDTMVLLKSALLFTSSPLMFHIFAENSLLSKFEEQINLWPETTRKKNGYHIYNLSFPNGDQKEWQSLFKPCASQRLFLPTLLSDVDALIYVDTDVLFLRSLDDLWHFFGKFNSTQLVALSPESEDSATGWYNRFSRHPFYGELGVNSGVMLMNLTRLRTSDWMESMLKFYKDFKLKITWGDQDLINIYFYYNPDQLYVYSCEWNFRPDHCMYGSVCKEAEVEGISVLHGSRGVWHSEKEPAFKAFHFVIKEFAIGYGDMKDLVKKLEREITKTKYTQCGKLSKLFTKQIERIANTTNNL